MKRASNSIKIAVGSRSRIIIRSLVQGLYGELQAKLTWPCRPPVSHNALRTLVTWLANYWSHGIVGRVNGCMRERESEYIGNQSILEVTFLWINTLYCSDIGRALSASWWLMWWTSGYCDGQLTSSPLSPLIAFTWHLHSLDTLSYCKLTSELTSVWKLLL